MRAVTAKRRHRRAETGGHLHPMTTQFRLPVPDYYNLRMTCHAHGWRYLAPFKWDERKPCLRFPVWLEAVPVDIEGCQIKEQIHVTVECYDVVTPSMEQEARQINYPSAWA